ncbi:hypothetical protein ADIS_2552 [Lunatimonas lonarensis]|uniref:Uncharacterized protein n=1 Tax=Lunatimonas lonarensis TaxID=1232681 RepID=R7ZSL8_9BACT|nr:hypothetical protein ADIS_2552 [Lunatimonas lonarensis]
MGNAQGRMRTLHPSAEGAESKAYGRGITQIPLLWENSRTQEFQA